MFNKKIACKATKVIMLLFLSITCFSSNNFIHTYAEEENEKESIYFGEEKYLMSAEEFQNRYNSETSPLARSALVRVRHIADFELGWISIMTLDGQVVFCLDPYLAAGIGDNYEDNYSWWNLDWNTRYRIWLVIRFGYQQYGSDNYYIASQILLWRALGHYMTPSINVDAEIAQIEVNIANYGDVPSFSGGTFTLEYLEELTLVDSKSVLNGFSISCGIGIECTKEGNNLKVKITDLNYDKTNSVNGSYGSYAGVDAGVVYQSPGRQDVLLMPLNDPVVSFRLGLRMLTGNLKVNKLDEFDLLAEAGQPFELAWDIDFTNVIGTFTSDYGLLEIKDLLPAGTYYIREIGSTNPYTVNPTIYQFDIVLNDTTEITIINNLREVELHRTKDDIEEPTLLLNGAEFTIEDVTEANQIQATDPQTGDPLWEDAAQTIPVLVWDNPIYEYTVATGNQYIRIYDLLDHSQPLPGKEVVFSYVNTFDQALYPLITNAEGLINLTENGIIAEYVPVLDVNGDPTYDVNGDPILQLIHDEVFYRYIIVDDDPNTAADETEYSAIVRVELKTEEDLLGWANLPMKHSRIYWVCETKEPIGYEIEGNACKLVTMDLASGIDFKADLVSNKLRRLLLKYVKMDSNNSNNLLNHAVFDIYDTYYADLDKPKGEYLGRYVTGAFFVFDFTEAASQATDPQTGDPLWHDSAQTIPMMEFEKVPNDNIEYRLFDEVTHDAYLLDPTVVPTHIFITNGSGEILQWISEGKYFVYRDTATVPIEYIISKGTIWVPEVKYGHELLVEEIKAPAGYHLPKDTAHMIIPTADVSINQYESFRVNQMIIMPNTGEKNNLWQQLTELWEGR